MKKNRKDNKSIIIFILIILGLVYMILIDKIFSGKLYVKNVSFVIALLIVIAIIIRIFLEKKIGNIK